MDEAGETHTGHMPRRREHALEIPDGLLRCRELLLQKAAAIILREHAVKAPLAAVQWADIQQFNDQKITGLRTAHTDRPRKVVHLRKFHIAHVSRVIVVRDLATGPIIGLDDKVIARVHPLDNRDIRVPAVVDFLVGVRAFVEVDPD